MATIYVSYKHYEQALVNHVVDHLEKEHKVHIDLIFHLDQNGEPFFQNY